MALVSNSFQTFYDIKQVVTPVWHQFYGPQWVLPPTNPPSAYCRPFGFQVMELTKPRTYLLSRVTGRKNVPYIPSIHNQTPLAYERLYTYWTDPVLISKDLKIKHDFSGWPIDCPSVPSPASRFDGAGVVQPLHRALTQQLINTAMAKANGKIADQKNVTVNWANTVGEHRDTRKMMYRSLNDIVKTVRFLRRGKYEKAYSQLFGNIGRTTFDPLHQKWRYVGKRNKRSASSLWLEWHYGWVPLVTDVYDGLGDMRASTAPLILTARGHARDHGDDVETRTCSFGMTDRVNASVTFNVRVRREIKYSVSLRYRVLNTILSDLNSAGIINPLELAWELTPFSFVADWFVNVGDYLRSTTIGTGLQFLNGTASTLQRTEAVAIGGGYKVSGRSASYHSVEGTGSVQWFYNRHDFSRTVISSPPTMSIGFQQTPFTVKRFVSAAALLKQLLVGWDGKRVHQPSKPRGRS